MTGRQKRVGLDSRCQVALPETSGVGVGGPGSAEAEPSQVRGSAPNSQMKPGGSAWDAESKAASCFLTFSLGPSLSAPTDLPCGHLYPSRRPRRRRCSGTQPTAGGRPREPRRRRTHLGGGGSGGGSGRRKARRQRPVPPVRPGSLPPWRRRRGSAWPRVRRGSPRERRSLPAARSPSRV